MDEDLKIYLAAMEVRLLVRMNDQHERLISSLNALRSDFANTKDFLLRDSLVNGRRWLDLEARVSKLEGDKKS